MNRARALLATGGNGFVMSHVVRRWLERFPTGNVLLIDTAPPDEVSKAFFGTAKDRIEFIARSITDDGLWRMLQDRHDIIHVVHGAAVTSINRRVHAHGRGRPGLAGARDSIAVNIDGTLNVLQLAARLPHLSRMVNVSSGSVYACQGPDPLPEDGHVDPEGIYPITKYAGERFTAYAADQLGLPAVSVRLSGVFGPMDRETAARDVRSAPRAIAERGIARETVRVRTLEGAGDFVYAGDVADAVVSLLEVDRLHHPVYNIAAGALTTIGELLEAFGVWFEDLRAEEVPSGDVDVDYPQDQRHGRFGAYDISRIQADAGWSPRPLVDTVGEYVSWLRSV